MSNFVLILNPKDNDQFIKLEFNAEIKEYLRFLSILILNYEKIFPKKFPSRDNFLRSALIMQKIVQKFQNVFLKYIFYIRVINLKPIF